MVSCIESQGACEKCGTEGSLGNGLCDRCWDKQFSKMTPIHGDEHLTDREVEILRLVQGGMRSSAIADHLGVRQQTIRNYLAVMYVKCRVPRWANPMAWLAVNADNVIRDLNGGSR